MKQRASYVATVVAVLLIASLARGAEPSDGDSGEKGNTGVVVAPSDLVVEGLEDTYEPDEPIEFTVRVPKSNVLRARTEVLVLKGDGEGEPVYRNVNTYDRFSIGDTFSVEIDLPRAQQSDEMTLLVQVTGLSEDPDGTMSGLEERYTYHLSFAEDDDILTQKSERLKQRLFFDSNAYALTDEHEEKLAAVVETLKAEEHLDHVLVEGHTDQVGSAAYNKELSRKRATSAVEYLVRHGIPRRKVRHLAYGFKHPHLEIDGSGGSKAVRENRRVEFVVFRKAPETPSSGGEPASGETKPEPSAESGGAGSGDDARDADPSDASDRSGSSESSSSSEESAGEDAGRSDTAGRDGAEPDPDEGRR